MTATLSLVVDNDGIPEVCDVAEQLCNFEDAIDDLQVRRTIPLTYLWEKIGKEMLAKGQRTKVLDGFKYHVAPPQERQYCGCHLTLLYQCTTPIAERPPDVIRLDSHSNFYVTRVKE